MILLMTTCSARAPMQKPSSKQTNRTAEHMTSRIHTVLALDLQAWNHANGVLPDALTAVCRTPPRDSLSKEADWRLEINRQERNAFRPPGQRMNADVLKRLR